jgi:Tfp pilus assembly protein PilX
MNHKNEKGIALILTMILVLIMSVMAVSLMFISQSETWASLNYRLASQARDGAEAGVHSAANFIVNIYTTPGSVGDPLSAYNYTSVYPVQAGAANTSGHDVYLSANTFQQASTYPASSVQTSYNTAGNGKGSLTSGNSTVSYATTAKLLSMTQLNSAISGSTAVVQTWQITSDGSISGIRNANVEVSAILEHTVVPTFNYATFGSSSGCSALTFGGGGTTDSYDSSTFAGVGTPTTSPTFGNIGTNGNVATNGGTTTINGSLSTPRAGNRYLLRR